MISAGLVCALVFGAAGHAIVELCGVAVALNAVVNEASGSGFPAVTDADVELAVAPTVMVLVSVWWTVVVVVATGLVTVVVEVTVVVVVLGAAPGFSTELGMSLPTSALGAGGFGSSFEEPCFLRF